ncbi:hypothetical protein TVAG_204410 [Trichomonas vaginalis G3]|uniref:Uncharacterized protein n=1 Tax=Trichomonas vaginalis (strain ATCC PRA-98 / G3) TaxID=412133 RepID=A2FJ35_TRIV3|nr:ubiquitinyl hydrolase protein [Trichomonas vaginalis G3]EAX95099.1 hypothetical protein TVAG_204410 [Trichomonas vaginalis G3]KAI5501934.1 ubiquitinyl hydrolase protein [Trichomonas vaginalis G3]|eukprot:XP_001308029.1 hypothetical protein [Trichomonas vaginalis G3]
MLGVDSNAQNIKTLLEAEKFFDKYEITQARRILSNTRLSTKDYISMLKQGSDKYDSPDLFYAIQNAHASLNYLDETLMIIKSLQKCLKLAILEDIINKLNPLITCTGETGMNTKENHTEPGDVQPFEEDVQETNAYYRVSSVDEPHIIGDIEPVEEDTQKTKEYLVKKHQVPIRTTKEVHKMTTVEEDYIKKWNKLVSTNSLETLLAKSKSEVKNLFKELLDTDYPELNKIIIQKVKSEPKVFNIQYEVFNQMSSNLSIPRSLRYSLIPILASKTTDFKVFLQNLHK